MTISAYNLVPIAGAPRADGSRVRAAFDAVVVGVRLIGCVIIQKPNGILEARPPQAKCRHIREYVVKLVDPVLDHESQKAALAAYSSLAAASEDDSRAIGA